MCCVCWLGCVLLCVFVIVCDVGVSVDVFENYCDGFSLRCVFFVFVFVVVGVLVMGEFEVVCVEVVLMMYEDDKLKFKV